MHKAQCGTLNIC